MTSTRGNPRLGQSSSALSSLGAVGGPRGTAAGALRVIVEFLTQYDPKAIKTLEADLKGLSELEQQLGNDEISIADRVAKQRTKIAQAESLQKAKFTDREAKAALRQSQALRETGRPSDTRQAQQLLTFAIKRQGLSKEEERVVRGLVAARTRLVNLERQQAAIQADRLGVAEQEAAVQGQLSTFANLKANLPSKLGGLALGAVGGLVGGAIIGVGFEAAQAAMDAIAEIVKDLVDPLRHAREAAKDVAEAILDIKKAGDSLTTGEAVDSYLKSLGINANEAVKGLFALIAEQKREADLVAEIQRLGLASQVRPDPEVEHAKNIKIVTDALIAQAAAAGTTRQVINSKGQISADRTFYEAQAMDVLANAEARAAEQARILTADQARLQRNLEATAALANIAARALSEAISAGTQSLTGPIDNRISSLQDAGGESARTRAIQKKIESLQNGGGSQDASRNRELANIQEERSLILLRQRLRLLGTNIDLEKFEGKFLLEAINAKIKALDKQAAAQDRLNKELDLQLRASTVLRRQEGETVSDFLERRAKENRDVLSEQRALETEKVKERLQELQEKTQDEVALAELSERKQTSLAKTGSDDRIKNLQKELEASKKADAAALKNKIAALEKQRDALKQQAENAEYYATEAANDEIRQAIRAANTIEKLAKLSGAARGLESAKAFLTALLQSGVLNPVEAAQVQAAIKRISSTLSALGDQQYGVMKNAIVRPGQAPHAFAAGGFIPLNAGSTPFGNSAKFGEHGTEAGMMVMTTNALNKMRNGKGSGAQFGDIYINGSDDPQRDAYRTEKAIEKAMRKALN